MYATAAQGTLADTAIQADDLINDLSRAYEFPTVAAMLSSAVLLANNKVVKTQRYNLDVVQQWAFVTAEPVSGFYLTSTGVTGFFVPKRKVKTRANLREFGLSEYVNPGVGVGVECSALIATAFADGVNTLTIDDDCYIGTSGTDITQDSVTVTGTGKIWIDWNILPAGTPGTPIYPLTFSGDSATFKHVDSGRVGGAVAWVEDEDAAMLFMIGENSKVRHTDANHHPNYCFAFGVDKKIKFVSNTGVGLLDGASLQQGIHCLLFMKSTLNSSVRFNGGSGWCNGILLGLSPDGTNLYENSFFDCGNHCIYGSSADRTTMSHNHAAGQFTDIKVRGDYNTCIGNDTLGGSLTMTNRISDTGDGLAAHSMTAINNVVNCDRDLAVGLSMRGRTGVDGAVKKITCIGNTVTCTGAGMPNGILILFTSIETVNFSNNELTCLGTVTDGIRITPTDGFNPDNLDVLSITGGFSIGAVNQAYQLVATKLTMTGFRARSGGGTGSSNGVVVAHVGRANISTFDIEVTTNVSAINFRAGVSAMMNVGTITRPIGGTATFIIATGFTPNEGAQIEKVTLV